MVHVYQTGNEHEFINYGLDAYPNNYFDTFVDIGGCYGTISFMIAEANPKAKILCYEPSIDEYDELKRKASIFPNIVVVKEALGNGDTLFFENRGVGRHTCEEVGEGCPIQSRTLKQIFESNNIDINTGKIGLKIDCEGGERYMINDPDSTDIIKKCSHFCIEVHFKWYRLYKNKYFFSLPDFIDYDNWIRNSFCDTHNIKYWKSNRYNGHGIYVLVNK